MRCNDDRYRYGYVNAQIEKGVEYKGHIVGFYDWCDTDFLQLLLVPPVAADKGQDVVEIALRKDQPPERFNGKDVRVVLGDYVDEETYCRWIEKIESDPGFDETISV